MLLTQRSYSLETVVNIAEMPTETIIPTLNQALVLKYCGSFHSCHLLSPAVRFNLAFIAETFDICKIEGNYSERIQSSDTAERTHVTKTIKGSQAALLTCVHLHPRSSMGVRRETGQEEGDESSFACEGL